MKKYFEHLRPMERRLVIGTGVLFLVVLNWWYVWPHFSDWSNLSGRLEAAKGKLKLYQTAVAQKPELERSLGQYESAGQFVAPDDQAVYFMRTIQQQASACGFGIQNYSRSMMNTNQFFVNQIQNITVSATEGQLVDFLYKLGSDASMVRVRDLDLQPNQARQRLDANIKLVASYQKSPKAAAPAAYAGTNSTEKAK